MLKCFFCAAELMIFSVTQYSGYSKKGVRDLEVQLKTTDLLIINDDNLTNKLYNRLK